MVQNDLEVFSRGGAWRFHANVGNEYFIEKANELFMIIFSRRQISCEILKNLIPRNYDTHTIMHPQHT